MLAMGLLMVDFVAIPVLAIVLVALLGWYWTRWAGYRDDMRESN